MIPYCILVIEDENDRAFMTELYLDYQKLMYSQIQRITKNEYDTEDVLQSVLEKLIDKIPTLKGLTRTRKINYIISACKFTAYNFGRDRHADMEIPLFEGTDLPDYNNDRYEMELRIIKEEELRALAQIWDDLDPRTQSLLEGYYLLEKPMSELAEDLGIAASSVRMALTRARRKVLELLSKDLDKETTTGAH